MPIVIMPERALVTVTGPDAGTLLQGLVTTDLDQLGEGDLRPGALLSPQGKILFDFLVSRTGDGFRLDCRDDVAEAFAKRLTLYKLRAKAAISVDNQPVVAASWEVDSAASYVESADGRRHTDLRFLPSLGVGRIYATPADGIFGDADSQEWHTLRIERGIPESGFDYALGDAFPHDVLLDQLGGVGFRKGCYVGQEVVSRMQHRGTARRRVLIARSDAALPAAGTDITAASRSVGAMGSSSGTIGLALVRIDKVKAAIDDGVPIMVAGIPLDLAIPAFATFGFPETAAAEDA